MTILKDSLNFSMYQPDISFFGFEAASLVIFVIFPIFLMASRYRPLEDSNPDKEINKSGWKFWGGASGGNNNDPDKDKEKKSKKEKKDQEVLEKKNFKRGF